jgi:hypothetical protein
MQERRQLPRSETLRRAHIVLAAGRPPIACTVHNISPIGALVRLDEPLQLAGSLHLLFNGTELRQCVVARQANRDIGLHFRST